MLQAERLEIVRFMAWVVCGRSRCAIQRILFFLNFLLDATESEFISVEKSLGGTQVCAKIPERL